MATRASNLVEAVGELQLRKVQPSSAEDLAVAVAAGFEARENLPPRVHGVAVGQATDPGIPEAGLLQDASAVVQDPRPQNWLVTAVVVYVGRDQAVRSRAGQVVGGFRSSWIQMVSRLRLPRSHFSRTKRCIRVGF